MQKKCRIMQFPEEKNKHPPFNHYLWFIHPLIEGIGRPRTRNKKVFITSTFYSFKKFLNFISLLKYVLNNSIKLYVFIYWILKFWQSSIANTNLVSVHLFVKNTPYLLSDKYMYM